MLITFKRLILELTRQCNMRCAHCMRGEPEDKTIGTSILERLFREVRHIEHLGLTGGEPALVPEQIEWIVHLAKRWGCTIGLLLRYQRQGVFPCVYRGPGKAVPLLLPERPMHPVHQLRPVS